MLKEINAMILVKSLITGQHRVSKALAESAFVGKDNYIKKVKEQVINSMLEEVRKNYSDIVECTDVPYNEILFKAELLVFTTSTFKNAVEFVIQELSMERINQIKNQKL
jgi:hypothetical protein